MENGDNLRTLENALVKANEKSDAREKNRSGTYNCITQAEERIEEKISKGISYSRKLLYDIRDAFVAEGAFEAIKFACGVDTTGQLIKKAGFAVVAATGISSPFAAYQVYTTAQQPEPQTRPAQQRQWWRLFASYHFPLVESDVGQTSASSVNSAQRAILPWTRRSVLSSSAPRRPRTIAHSRTVCVA